MLTTHCQRPKSGFTLLEVVLAVAIAVGLLTVALYFYTQIERLRSDLITQSSQISAARLLLDRVSVELNSLTPAVSSRPSIVGGSNFLELVLTDFPKPSMWNRTPEAALRTPTTPFRIVRYGGPNGASSETTVTDSGVKRSEEVLLKKKLMPSTSRPIQT